MAEKYQICFMMPKDYQGPLVFRELLFLFRNSFRSLGYDCTIKPNQLADDRVNIIIGYHLLSYGDYLKTQTYIPYQLEQLDAKVGWYNEESRRVLGGAEEIWDYSLQNIDFLEGVGLSARHLPVGYHKSLEIIEEASEKDIDVLFYGTINERRKAVLDELSRHVRVEVLAGVYGSERDEFIARSKINLNMHFYETKILECVRISYLLNNKCFVITEDSADNPYAGVGLVTAPYDKLVAACLDHLGREAEIDRIRSENYSRFKEDFAMPELLAPVLTNAKD